jgi:hypothetical protein
MEALRNLLADRVVEVDVLPVPEPGMDPNYIPRITGQGVCVDAGPLGTVVVVSQFLVVSQQQIRSRTRKNPSWVEMRVVRTSPSVGLAMLGTPGAESAFSCQPVPLAPPAAIRDKALVFTVDAPTALPNLFWGFVEGFAEPPLERFFLTATGLPLSYPLFTAAGELLGLNVRRYTPQASVFLAATANQIRRLLMPPRPSKPETGRRNRRGPVE